MSSTLREPGTRAPGFLPPDPRVEEPYRFTPQMALRIAVLGVLAIVVFAVLFFRLWALQVISGERYLEDARNNQIRSFRLWGPPGGLKDPPGAGGGRSLGRGGRWVCRTRLLLGSIQYQYRSLKCRVSGGYVHRTRCGGAGSRDLKTAGGS